jgi:hypothetical protein
MPVPQQAGNPLTSRGTEVSIPARCDVVSRSVYYFGQTLETSGVIPLTTQCHISKVLHLQHHRCERLKFRAFKLLKGGPGSSVGIATGYGLDGPRIESRWGRDFLHLSRPALGPTQPPVKSVPFLSRGKEWPERDADPSLTFSAVVMKG